MENTLPETTLLRHLYTSNVLHLIDTKAPVLPDADPDRPRAMCGTKPFWPGIWWEPQTTDNMATFGLCRNCESAKEAATRVES